MTTHRFPTLTIALLTMLGGAHLAGAADESYGYFRVVEGSATVTPADGETREPAEINLPVLTGDRVEVSPRSRLEIVLADRNRLRLDGDTRIVLQAMAFSSDANARASRLQLLAGTAQLVVGEEALGDELPRIDLANATVYLQDVGDYRLSTDGESWSELVVRQGYAEVVTERGSTVVRTGEAARVTGERWTSTRLGPAPPADSLERWAMSFDSDSPRRRGGYVDGGLAYSAASLDDYGSWVYTDDAWAWRPRVEVDWRPYWNGRWYNTPSGLTWVSTEPWGWVPYHYGTWTLSTSYGWVWLPGRTYSPAWVYWYWGNQWAGWCPVGYYTRYYRGGHWDRGFRFGVYGSIGGDLGLYAHWNFGPVNFLFDRHRGGHWRGGRDLGREFGHGGLPRGVLTTDTRGLDPDRLRRDFDPRELTRGRGGPASPVDRLPDVTDFVARKPELSPEVRRRIVAQEPEQGATAGTPLSPPALSERPVRERPGWKAPREPEGTPALGERPVRVGGARPVPPVGSGDSGAVLEGSTGASGRSRPRVEIDDKAPVLDERPARRARPAAPQSGSPALDERPAWRGVPSVPAETAPSRRPRVTRDEVPAVESAPADSSPASRQNWRLRGPREGGAGSSPGESSSDTASPWPAPQVRAPRWSAPPAGAADGRRVRDGALESQPADSSPVFERPSRRQVPAWRGPSSGETPQVMPDGSGESLVDRPARAYGERRSPPREAPSMGSDRPAVRRVIDGVRQSPSTPPRMVPSSSGSQGSTPAPSTSAPRTERSRESRGGREGSASSGRSRKSPPPDRD